jgi:hypothetical protein
MDRSRRLPSLTIISGGEILVVGSKCRPTRFVAKAGGLAKFDAMDLRGSIATPE